MSLKPILDIEFFLVVEAFEVSIKTSFAVFRMNSRCPSVSKFLFQGAPGKFKPFFIKEKTLGICSRHPYQHRSGIGNGAKPLLTFFDPMLISFFFCEVAYRTHHFEWLIIFI